MLVHSKFISASLAFLLELTPPQFQSSFAKEPKSFNSIFTEVMFDKLWKWKVLSHVQLFATPGLYSPLNSPDQNTGVGSLSLFRRSYQSRDWTHISCIAGGFFFFFLPFEPPGKSINAGVCSRSLLQGIFLSQKSNWGLLHYRKILYQLS